MIVAIRAMLQGTPQPQGYNATFPDRLRSLMEQTLKRRLVGAAVLVALAVIVVPMLVDGPGPEQTPAEQIPLGIPSAPAGPQQTRDIPLTLPTPAAADPAQTAGDGLDDPNRVVTVDASEATPAPRTVDPDPVAPPTDAPQPNVPEAGPAGVTSQKPAPVSAPPKPVAAAPAAPAAEGRFVVNLGSFANSANAEALRGRLQRLGVPILVEALQIDGKPAQRLRAGPYATQARAEEAMLVISRAEPGQGFSVGELDEGKPLAPAQRPGVSAGFAVQLGALKEEKEANALRDRLRGAGFAAFVQRADTDAGVLWRVRAGPELDRARAEAMRDRIRSALKLEGLVVSHP